MGFSAVLLFFLLPNMFLQFGGLILGPLIFGHGPPLCSTTRNCPRLSGVFTATLRMIGQRSNTMNRIRLLPIGTVGMFALTLVAQQATTRPGGPAKSVSGNGDAPTVQQQLKLLSEKLHLTADQQARITPDL